MSQKCIEEYAPPKYLIRVGSIKEHMFTYMTYSMISIQHLYFPIVADLSIWMVVWNMFQYIENNHPSCLSCFPEG